jgi:hypothetical protein
MRVITALFLFALETLRASQMGVDRSGNLWAWNDARGSLTRVAPNGVPLTISIPDAKTVDADEERGIVALTHSGRELRFFDWHGKLLDTLPLPNEVATLCWSGPHQVAVTPRLADHRIEIWDANGRALVRRLWPTAPVATTAGAHPAHATLVRYDAARGELLALDAFAGELSVYANDGALLRHARIAGPAPDVAAWLADMDRDARRAGRTVTPSLWTFPSMALAPDGSLWLGSAVDGTRVAALRVTRGGQVQRTTIAAGPCASLTFEAWQDRFIFYRDPKAPRPACAGTAPIPEGGHHS